LLTTHSFVVELVSALFASLLGCQCGHRWLDRNYTTRLDLEEKFEIEQYNSTRRLDANPITSAKPDEEAPRSHGLDGCGRVAAASELIAIESVCAPGRD